MLNHIDLQGTLTRDPELRYTQNQNSVTSFRIACARDYVPQGQSRETDYIDCIAWRNTAEFVSKYFSKGSKVVISGRLQMREWTDKEGNKRVSAEVVCEHVYFGENKQGEARSTTQPVIGINVDASGFIDADDDAPLPF